MMASDEPMVTVPKIFRCSPVMVGSPVPWYQRWIIFATRWPISAVFGYSDWSMNTLPMVLRINSSASGSI